MLSLKIHLDGLINKLFKIIPLKENNDKNLDRYIDSLCVDLLGSSFTFRELLKNQNYITIVNTIEYLRVYEYDFVKCKREVFKCISLVEKIKKELCGDSIE